MSRTLKKILEHIPGPLPEDLGVIEFPFHLENFCREMDELFKKFEAENKELKVIISGKTFSEVWGE